MNRELEKLNQKVRRVMETVEHVLQRELGENRTISQLTLRDRYLLTNLEVWSERYKVSLDWITEMLILHYHEIVKNKTKKRKKMGLPVRVSVLVSQTSEQWLNTQLDTLFPEDEHLKMWREQEQERILEERMERGEWLEGVQRIPPEVTELSFKTLKDYQTQYRNTTEKRRRMWKRMREQEQKEGLPYRGSPWR